MHRKKQNAYSKQLVNGNIFGSVHILDTGDRENEKTIFNLGRHGGSVRIDGELNHLLEETVSSLTNQVVVVAADHLLLLLSLDHHTYRWPRITGISATYLNQINRKGVVINVAALATIMRFVNALLGESGGRNSVESVIVVVEELVSSKVNERHDVLELM